MIKLRFAPILVAILPSIVACSGGGLEPGETIEDDFLITVAEGKQAASVRFEITSVRGG